jgi:glutathione S-transferase
MADLCLYHAVPSRSMVVHWMLEELGEPYDLELLSLEAEDHKKPAYLAINPMGKVPALRHGNIIVTETAAICAYLADVANICAGCSSRPLQPSLPFSGQRWETRNRIWIINRSRISKRSHRRCATRSPDADSSLATTSPRPMS